MSLDPHSAADQQISPADLQRIDEALARHGLTRRDAPRFLPNSALNQNFHVATAERDVVVRVHRQKQERETLELELRAIEFGRQHGIPARLPLAGSDGRSFHSIGGRFVSVSPWLEAVPAHRGSLTPDQSAAMGEMHGRIHAAFANFSDPALPAPNPDWDTEQSIADLSRVDDLIRYYPAPGQELLGIQDGLRFKLELLESGAARPKSDFPALPEQPIHGDYHDGNVLFAGDNSILAVIDWELVRTGAPVLELLRSLTFSDLLAPGLLEEYLRRYAREKRFSRAECEVGVEVFWQARLHGTWIYNQRFIQGFRAVDRFFAPEDASLRRLADPAFRQWLASQLLQYTAAL